MSTQPRLVNKQFNSPIGLYSEQNIREVLSREQQILANGAVGIDFHNPTVGKPTNLQNSAVLRMLEEEEIRQRGGRAGVKRVAWPPPQEGGLDSFVEQPAAQVQGGPQHPNQTPSHAQNNYSPQHAPSHLQQQPSQQGYRPLRPLDVNSVGSGSPLASPHVNQGSQGFRPSTPAKGWAPVQSPGSTPQYQAVPYQFGAPGQQYQQSQPQYQPTAQSGQQYQAPYQQHQASPYQSQPQYQSQSFSQPPQQNQAQPRPVAAQAQAAPITRPQAKQVEPPPSTITLRQQAPVSQAAPPVFSAQPATASLKVVVGGKNLRGDLKWPPENVKSRMEEEKQMLIELAKGPACRPLKREKDYTPFFEAHALNSSYPGYKIPPGTQFYRPA